MDFLIIIIRTLGGYFLLILMLKIMGKREIGQLSLFDLIILLSLADIMIIGIENFKISYWYVIIPILLLTFLQKTIAFVILKSSMFRKIFDGKESLIICKGELNVKEMKKLCYNFDDLLSQLRQKDIRSIKDVEYAVLETGGKLSVFCYSDNNVFPLPIITGGVLQREYLEILKISEKWVMEEIFFKKVKLSEIAYAFYEKGQLLITLTKSKKER